jgi:ubiquinol-cytochrome c reductase cytochrome b subunit
MLMIALLEGYLGYSLVDDLLSGMGLAIGYAVVLSIPFIGANIAQLLWNGPYPGGDDFESRMYLAHVLLLPLLIGTLIVLHLTLVASRHHTQFLERRTTEKKVVGMPTFPAYAPRSLGLAFGVAAVLFLMGGLIQINPIWQWGPYHVSEATNGAQPDWYLGWLIGGLRMMPSVDVRAFGRTLIPNPFWGGVLFPAFVFGYLLAHPWLERTLTRDRAAHHLLDRPRDHPWRTAFGAAFLTWVGLVFFAGSSDRLFFQVGIDYEAQIHVYRVLFFVLPAIAFVATKSACEALRRSRAAPLRGGPPRTLRRRPDGGFEELAD